MNSKSLIAKRRKEISKEYEISVRTLGRWFKKADLKIPNGLIDPYHLKLIYKTFGIPKMRK